MLSSLQFSTVFDKIICEGLIDENKFKDLFLSTHTCMILLGAMILVDNGKWVDMYVKCMHFLRVIKHLSLFLAHPEMA